MPKATDKPNRTSYEFHPVAEIFDPIMDTEFDDLVEDIRKHGLLEPIVLYENKILDGRNRYRACKKAGQPPRFRKWNGKGSPIDFVVSMNRMRRHLTFGQKVKSAVRAKEKYEEEAKKRQGTRTDIVANLPPSETGKARDKAGAAFGVSGRSVSHGERVFKQGVHELQEAVETGELSVSTGAEIAREDPKKQRDILKSGEHQTIQAAKKIRQKRTKKKREERVQSLKKTKWPSDRFRVIYCDPPWSYSNKGNIESYGHAERHYQTMSTDRICAMKVGSISLKNAVLFLWATSPMLEDAFKVIKAWGYHYKTSFVWDKQAHNWGYYNSVQHEFLLLATRGSCQPDIDKRLPSIVRIKRSKKHSEKPEEFRKMIDKMYPNGPRIELFSRKTVKDWEAFGNEIK